MRLLLSVALAMAAVVAINQSLDELDSTVDDLRILNGHPSESTEMMDSTPHENLVILEAMASGDLENRLSWAAFSNLLSGAETK